MYYLIAFRKKLKKYIDFLLQAQPIKGCYKILRKINQMNLTEISTSIDTPEFDTRFPPN